MFRRTFSRSLLGLLTTATIGILGISGVFAAAPAQAYGPENYQQTFAGKGLIPGGNIGFWGWCTYGGGTGSLPTSGTTGDCSYAYYVHTSTTKIDCHQSVDFTAWTIQPSAVLPFTDFFVTGTASVQPPNATDCYSLFPGIFAPSFTDVDTLVPAIPGHYNENGATLLGITWPELQYQVTAIP